jgi:Icc-related predicted phosphoesterase
MKILIVADVESKALWDFYDPERVEGVDLILSAGDLNPRYLEFLVTMINKPLLYIHGNHDSEYDQRPPEGCVCIEDRIVDFHGLRILGEGGSLKYRPSSHMYTEREMQMRLMKADVKAALSGGFDIFLTHSPCRGYRDMEDMPHRGYECFNSFLQRWKPAYMIHGHVHRQYQHDFKRAVEHPSGTRIINGCDWYILEIGEDELRRHRNLLPVSRIC